MTRQRKRQKVNVNAIQTEGELSLIEWVDDGRYLRSLVPSADVTQGQCEYPERGLPYGANWAELITAIVEPEAIANLLRKRNIWTIEELLANPREAQSAINEAASVLLSNLLSNARAVQKGA
jgi:hypothetical protein